MGLLKWFPTRAADVWAPLSAVRVGANCIRPSTYQKGTGAPDGQWPVNGFPSEADDGRWPVNGFPSGANG